MDTITSQTEQSIGAALRRARLQAGLTQKDMAEQADLSLLTIKKLENGRGNRLSTLIAVLGVLGLESSIIPQVPNISPMQILENRRHAPAQRVRHSRAAK